MSLALGMKLRTRSLLWLMRLVPDDVRRQAHEGRIPVAVERSLMRGELQIISGLGVNLRFKASSFPYWGAQSYGVLTGEHELTVQAAMRRTLGEGSVFIDVGCNIGMMSLLAARFVGARGRVIGLDVAPECVQATAANAALNGFDQVEVMRRAAAAANGQLEVIVTADSLWTRLADVGEHPLERRRETVPAVRLDDLADELGLERVDLVKIDVEGAELDVLAGMTRLLATQRPAVICEMHGHNAEFSRAMREMGYRVINLDGAEPVEHGSPNTHAFCEPWPVAPPESSTANPEAASPGRH